MIKFKQKTFNKFVRFTSQDYDLAQQGVREKMDADALRLAERCYELFGIDNWRIDLSEEATNRVAYDWDDDNEPSYLEFGFWPGERKGRIVLKIFDALLAVQFVLASDAWEVSL